MKLERQAENWDKDWSWIHCNYTLTFQTRSDVNHHEYFYLKDNGNLFTHSLFFYLPVFLVIHSLRDVRVKIPTAARKSDNVVLNCYYDMEGDSLYSVKWYKGRREFYRYSPKENPAMKTFPIGGVHVVVNIIAGESLSIAS